MIVNSDASLCMGGSKEKLKCIPEKRDTAETFDPNVLFKLVILNFNPQCNVTVIYWILYTKC